ncbi:hypothetical protein PpBr36_01120 [Pyricularia pennisetigena]|uniref:hypothetical protein n=1 Tax=Pyricularia pennisetigena TaxID=1578925 RepID=UPI001152E1A9|nr:hypothetical protein PpBr36_01120 [Pyricularia pennisetigena]TLS28491.1 hypothetical protein PpBr36_01120 [Pyricularia pennisetigena]
MGNQPFVGDGESKMTNGRCVPIILGSVKVGGEQEEQEAKTASDECIPYDKCIHMMGWNAFKRRRPKGREPSPAAPAVQQPYHSSNISGIGRGHVDSTVQVAPPTRKHLTIYRAIITRKNTTTTTTAITNDAAPHEPQFVMAPAASLSPIVEEALHGRPPLAVKVQINILDRPAYTRFYASSQVLRPSNRLCQGLLRRVEHCSKEFITRRDSDALLHRRFGQAPSALRYEITYTIVRSGDIWAEETFKSYQRAPVTDELANEIILSTHYVVGLFLRQHDKEFKWTQEPASDRLSKRLSASSSLSPYDALTLGCIPQSRFIESTQSFEFIPGYSIELSFRSFTGHRRTQREWSRSLRLKSAQDAPLNLAQSERLLFDSFDAVNSAISAKRRSFELDHASCEWLEGPVDCQHFEENALSIELRIANNLGPVYEHMHRGIRSKLSMFRQQDGEDCYAFLRDVQTELLRLRDVADERVSHTNDFELRILELTGAQGWKISRPAKVTLDHTKSHSQRTVEAILDRVHTGITDVLRAPSASVHIAAYKRGHLILDREIGAQEGSSKKPSSTASNPVSTKAEKDHLVQALESRIRQDLDMLVKDTCSLEGLPEDDEEVPTPTTSVSPHNQDEDTQLDYTENSSVTQDPIRRFPLSKSPEESRAATPSQQSPIPLRRKKTFIMPASGDNPAYRVFPLVPEKFIQSRSRQNSESTLSSQVSESSPAVLKKVNVQPVHVIDPDLFRGHAFSGSDGTASEHAGTVPEILSEESDRSECGGTELSVAEDYIFTQESSLMSDAQDSVAGDIVELDCVDAAQAPVTHLGSQPAGKYDGLASEDKADRRDAEVSEEANKRASLGRDDESIPSTPGLSHGEGPSPRDSFLMTPPFSKSTPVACPKIPLSFDSEQAGEDGHFSYPPNEAEDEEKTPTGSTQQIPMVQEETPEPDTIVLRNADSFSQSEELFGFDEDQALTEFHPSASGTPTQAVAELAASLFTEPITVPDVEPPRSAGTIVPPTPAAQEAEDNIFDSAFAEKSVAQPPTLLTNPRPSTSLGDSLPELQPARSRRTIERPSPILITRNSVSSWEDYISASQRDSVDTIKSEVDVSAIMSDDQPTARPPSPTRRKSIPTAGVLGLHEAGSRGSGPFGALKSAFSGGQHWLDSERFRGSGSSSRPQTAPGLVAQKFFPEGASTPPPPESPVTPTTKSPRRPYIRKRTKSIATATIVRATPKRPHKSYRGRAKSAAFAELERGREQKQGKEAEALDRNGDKPMLPRFMMLFAGMAVASSMLNKN